MLRALVASAVLWVVSSVAPALAGPTLADDLATCRDKQSEDKAARFEACERVIAAGQATGKDLALAYAVRGQTFGQKRNYDKAIEAFGAAHDADPDEANYVNARGFAYEQKGDDDHAMADYNLVLQMRPRSPLALYNRARSICARARCKARSTISMPR